MKQGSLLHPFPEGWFFVCYADELAGDRLLGKTFMGRKVVAFRDPSGTARVLDALARGQDGAHAWPVQEIEGLVMAYHDAAGRAPTWTIPAFGLEGFSKLARHHFRIKGHPQDTTENCVDSAHLVTIHGYENVTPLRPPVIEGPHLTGAYQMTRGSRMGLMARLNFKVDVVFEVDVWGLGHSTVQISIPRYGMSVRLLTLATPSDGQHIDLHIALRIKELEHPERILPGLERVPRALLTSVILALSKRAYMHDIQQDFDIWENKTYLARPNLARNDGPILLFRRYCRQFYPEPGALAGEPAATGCA